MLVSKAFVIENVALNKASGVHSLISELKTISDIREIPHDALILTANRRLTRFLESEIAQFRGRSGFAAWPSMSIRSLNGWYREQWLAMQEKGYAEFLFTLLNPIQEQVIWENLFTENNQGFELLNVSDTAKLANEAWKNLRQWQISLNDLPDYTETLFFKSLVDAYSQFCEEHAVCDEIYVMQCITKCYQQEKIDRPNSLVLFGFNDLSPINVSLFNYWKTKGTEIYVLNFNKAESEATIRPCSTEDDEIRLAANWAAKLIDSTDEAEKSKLRIGIVVPELSQLRSKIERIFNQEFEPQSIFANQSRHSPGFNISAGTSLSNTPPIAAALLALDLNKWQVERETLQQVLLSPFIGHIDELPSRAFLDIEIGKLGNVIRQSQFFAHCAEFYESTEFNENAENPKEGNGFYNELSKFQSILRSKCDKQYSLYEWANIFQSQLNALGWPGNRKLNTFEYQQIQKWHEVLDHFSSLDLILTKALPINDALYYLKICANVSFQAQTLSSPVQILGLLEAAGLAFDHLWIMQMDDQHWPMPCNPNPFLPTNLQAKFDMPKSSADGELRYAQALTEQFCRSAEKVIFSYSKTDEDREKNLSPILNHLPSNPVLEYSPEIDYYAYLSARKPELQTYFDHCGPSLDHFEHLKGGTQILKDHSACHFQSFAKHRLGISPPESYEPGIPARERGILIHQTLDTFWRKTANLQELKSLTASALEKLVEQAISQSLGCLQKNHQIGLKLTELEVERTKNIVLKWLDVEKQREDFKVIQREQARTLHFSKLPIHVRFDRLDELADGSTFVMDYKTGQFDLKAWVGERPDEPQIPIYAIANKNKLGAAAFALINAKNVGFKGVAKNSCPAPGIKLENEFSKSNLPEDWESLLNEWQANLENLAQSFVAGDADVNPKNSNTTCRYCGMQGLCRIQDIDNPDDYSSSTAAGEQ